jgi:ribulose-phosphate 3-epimerase
MIPKEPWIAPSILAADFSQLGEEVMAVIEGGADLIHFDVMDNHYVPNLTIGPPVCEALARFLKARNQPVELDVHLMVKPVDAIIPLFAAAGASYISIHPEATEHVDRSLKLIKELGCKAGLVLNPASSLGWLDHLLDKLDLLLLMSVNPGFGGQAFIDATLPKVEQARQRIDSSGRSIRLEVDGGIKLTNIGRVAAAGADTFVAGSAIFGSPDYAATISNMKQEIARAKKR